MKKAFIFLSVVIASISAMAQDVKKDIIYTTNFDVLEVKIIEVSNSEVKYKTLDNLEGPTFILSASEIGKIKLSNGTEKTFNTIKSKNTDGTTNTNSGFYPISRDNNGHYFMGNTRIDAITLENEFRKYPDALNLYKTGCTLKGIGSGFMGAGAGMCLGAVLALSINNTSLSNRISFGFIIAGAGMGLLVGVPIYVVGGTKVKEAIDVYNSQQSSKAYLQLQATENGIGLALKF